MAKQENLAHIYRRGEDEFRLTFISKSSGGAAFVSELRDCSGWELRDYLKDHMHPATDFDAILRSIGEQTEVSLVRGTVIRGHYENDTLVQSPATVEDMCQWMSEYQEKYFEGRKITVVVATVTKRDLHGGGCFGATMSDGGQITFSEELLPFGKCLKIVLLHELIHANLHVTGKRDPDKDHGESFKAEVKRLMNEGAYDSLL